MFRIAKYTRTTYAFNMEVETFVDLDHNFEAEVKFYYNRLNNNQYNLTPMRVPRGSYCGIMEKFRPMIMAVAKNNETNVYNPGGSACPRKKSKRKLTY